MLCLHMIFWESCTLTSLSIAVKAERRPVAWRVAKQPAILLCVRDYRGLYHSQQYISPSYWSYFCAQNLLAAHQDNLIVPTVRYTTGKSSPIVLLIISFFGASNVILAEPVGETTNNQSNISCKLYLWPGQVGCCLSAASSVLKTQRWEGLCTNALCVHSTLCSTSLPSACLPNWTNCPVKHTWELGYAMHRGKLQPLSVCLRAPLLQEAVSGVCFQ